MPLIRRSLTLLLPLALGFAAPGSFLAQTQARHDRLQLGDFLEWEEVVDFFGGGPGPQVSPDGRQVIYSRRSVDKVNDRWESALWIMSADGSRNRFLTKGADAHWSPDGTRIAFVRTGEPAGAQIFVRWMDAEGATTQITHIENGPGAVTWSPDGASIAFTMLVPSNEKWNVADMPSPPKDAKWAAEPHIVTRMNYRADRAGYVDQGYRHLFVVPASGGTPRQLTQGDWSDGAPAWTPDGREILFASLRVPEADYQWRETEIYATDVASGKVRQLTTRKGPDLSPTVSPDGKWVAYTGYDFTDDTYITNKLYVMAIDGSGAREIASGLDRSPEHLMWSSDGSGIYFSAQDRGTQNVWFAPVRGGAARRVTTGAHLVDITSMTPTGFAVGTYSSATVPSDVAAIDLKAGAVRRITDINGDVLAGKTLGDVEEIWYPSVDGLRVQGWIIKPPNFDPRRKYPLMLSIHGGPHGMFAVGTAYMWFEWQYYAANDFVVLYTNPRGSSGYGSSFGNAIKNAYPGKDYDDLMTAVDSVVKRGYVDSRNMFVYGCSGGGVLTAWTVGHTDRFAAASSECPVIDWMSFVGTTDGSSWYHNFAKYPWEDPSEHLRRSPLMYVGNVKTPTLLITGVNDLRTPISQTEEFYEALKVLKVPTAMIRLEDEWHAYMNRPSNQMRTIAYRKSWFERWRKNDTPAQ